MFTTYTYQDWLAAPDGDRLKLLEDIVRTYKASNDFKDAGTAQEYFLADNTLVASKVMLRTKKIRVKTKEDRYKSEAGTDAVIGNRIRSSFFFRFVTQQNQFLLGNGVTLKDETVKKQLGLGFDKAVEKAGECALMHGVCWGYWNLDHLEVLPAYVDDLSGFVALLDERTSAPGVGVQFWQMGAKRPMYVRLFEPDGLTEYIRDDDGMREMTSKRAYKETYARDAAGTTLVSAENYGVLPIVPFYASESKRSELTPSIKSKIDLYDNILSDFGDNLDRANDVYWVLNNFGGTSEDIVDMLTEIQRIKAVANLSDGTGSSSTAEPRTIEVPYAARQTALQLLEKALYQDYMAMSMDELTGGSLTNVAIETAMTNLNLKADRYEWQVFRFVQGLLALAGIQTEEITFKRQSIANKSEIVQDIGLMRDYIDDETALKLNPYILQEEIPDILNRTAAARLNQPQTPGLDNALGEMRGGGEDEQGT